MRKVFAIALTLALFLLPISACAGYYIFREDGAITEFGLSPDHVLNDIDRTTLSITLGGDCTLGSTESVMKNASGFVSLVKKHGYGYPFSELRTVFETDDITLVNLEGVLSDSSKGENTEKEYAFRGPADFAQILPCGSVEVVNLANNHTGDYGPSGKKDTVAALNQYGVAYGGDGWLCVYKAKGVLVGIGGTGGNWGKEKQARIKSEIQALRNMGCQVIVYSLHAGQEYTHTHNSRQQEMARFIIDAGADVVAGHHPHVLQGIEIYKDRLIIYSLGNLSFGGNHSPRDYDSMLVQLTLTLSGQGIEDIGATLHPVRMSIKKTGNDFVPVFMSGQDGEKVIKKVQADTPFPLPAYDPENGYHFMVYQR